LELIRSLVKDLATGINDLIRETISLSVPAKDHITMVIPQGMFSGRSVGKDTGFFRKEMNIDNGILSVGRSDNA